MTTGRTVVVTGASLVALLAPGALPEVAPITFVGEVLLLLWLLIKGRTVTGPATRSADSAG